MKRKNDPFAGIKITPRSGKQTITYNYQPGVKIRFTLNPTCAAGYLSRGTIGLLDPQTGHLLQTHTDSKSHRFSDAAAFEGKKLKDLTSGDFRDYCDAHQRKTDWSTLKDCIPS